MSLALWGGGLSEGGVFSMIGLLEYRTSLCRMFASEREVEHACENLCVGG